QAGRRLHLVDPYDVALDRRAPAHHLLPLQHRFAEGGVVQHGADLRDRGVVDQFLGQVLAHGHIMAEEMPSCVAGRVVRVTSGVLWSVTCRPPIRTSHIPTTSRRRPGDTWTRPRRLPGPPK